MCHHREGGACGIETIAAGAASALLWRAAPFTIVDGHMPATIKHICRRLSVEF